MKRMVSGIKPTGDLTLGNYIGAIKQFVKMQEEYESFIFIADLHAITIPQEKDILNKKIREVVALYIACGLKGDNTYLFNQSENIYHSMLSWVIESTTYVGEMSRMTQFKEKTENEKESSIRTSLFTYPALMAADILIYDADVVPVGEDQKQHIELTRNVAERFNNKYGETFKIPEPIVGKTGARIMDLIDPSKKMSSTADSKKGVIYLLDDLDVARKKIMSSVTDSDNKIIYDVLNKPGISNLMMIYSSLTDLSLKDVEKKFKDDSYGTFKKCVADEVVSLLTAIQTKYEYIIDEEVIDIMLDRGLIKAESLAKEKVYDVYHKLGLGRF